MKTYVQQFMLSQSMKSEKQTVETLGRLRKAGFDGIELCAFMTKNSGIMVRMLTKLAGMPVGKCGKYDWSTLVKEAGLTVPAFHVYLQMLENPKDYDAAVAEAKKYGTDTVVLTGMYMFDYSNAAEVHKLAQRLNEAGKRLLQDGMHFLYHNHNCELQRTDDGGKQAYHIITDETDPELVNFELDSYWLTEGGASALEEMRRLGSRMKMWHVNDRGHRPNGKAAITPIIKTDSMELGSGNMPLDSLWEQAKSNGCEAVVLESHRNWIDHSPVKSAEISAQYMKKHFV